MTTDTLTRDPGFSFWTKCIRESSNWSQEALAAASGLTVRTIQRIEAGEPTNTMTRRALARGLGYKNHDIFDDPVFIKSVQDLFDGLAKARNEQLEAQHPDHMKLRVSKVTAGNALVQLTCDSQGRVCHVDDTVSHEAKECAAILLDYLRDLGDICSELSYTDRLKCSDELEAMILELRKLGCACFTAERQTRIVGPNWVDKTPMPWKVAYLMVVTNGQALTEIIVPRKFLFR